MQNTTWGRKESIVWPYQIPIYAYSTAFFSAVLTFFFVCGWIRFGMTPLQRYYLPLYERISVIGAFSTTHQEQLSRAIRCGPWTLTAACAKRRCEAGEDSGARMAKPFLLQLYRRCVRSVDTRSFSMVRCAAFPMMSGCAIT